MEKGLFVAKKIPIPRRAKVIAIAIQPSLAFRSTKERARNTIMYIAYIGTSSPQKSKSPMIGLLWNSVNQPLTVLGCGYKVRPMTSLRVNTTTIKAAAPLSL